MPGIRTRILPVAARNTTTTLIATSTTRRMRRTGRNVGEKSAGVIGVGNGVRIHRIMILLEMMLMVISTTDE